MSSFIECQNGFFAVVVRDTVFSGGANYSAFFLVLAVLAVLSALAVLRVRRIR